MRKQRRAAFLFGPAGKIQGKTGPESRRGSPMTLADPLDSVIYLNWKNAQRPKRQQGKARRCVTEKDEET